MIQILFAVVVILHAIENALRRKKRLKRGDYRDIKKLPEVLFYSTHSIILGLIGYNVYNFEIWFLVCLSFLTRMVFFDITFNVFSGRNPSYENPNGNSLVDKIERFVPFWHRFILYSFAYIVLLWS